MLDKFKKVLFLSLFIISPILFNPFNGDVELIKVILISVFVCLFLIIIIFFIKIDFKFDKNSKVLIYLLCGFLIFAFISSLQNGFLTSLMGSYHRSHGLIIWLSCVLFAFITPYFIKDKKFLVKLIKILIWIGFLNAIIAVIFNNIGISQPFENWRLSGTMGNPNILGKLLLFTLILNLIFITFLKGKNKFFYYITLIGQLAVFILTGNRASWLAMGIICFILILKNPKKYFKYISISIAISIPFAIFIFQRLISTTSISTRLEIYKKALTALFNNSIFGYGFDFSPAVLTPDTYTLNVDRAHQLFLDIGLNIGIPGLILFILFTIISVYQLIKTENQYYKIFGYALLGLIISLQFCYFTAVTLLLFFLCIGINLKRSLQNNLLEKIKK